MVLGNCLWDKIFSILKNNINVDSALIYAHKNDVGGQWCSCDGIHETIFIKLFKLSFDSHSYIGLKKPFTTRKKDIGEGRKMSP